MVSIDKILAEQEEPKTLLISDVYVRSYISKMNKLNTSANYLNTKKNQLQDIIGKNKYKKQIILLLIILIVVLVLLLTFIAFCK
jgi:hypothetical protein